MLRYILIVVYIFCSLLYIFFLFYIFFISSWGSVKFLTITSVPYDMVYVSGDSYTLLFKESNDVTKHEVMSFLIDKYPTTNRNYFNFIVFNFEWDPISILPFYGNSEYVLTWLLNENFFLIANDPVVNVSWYAGLFYCRFYDKRLPTIDEWEYVAMSTEVSSIGVYDFAYIQKILNWYTHRVGRSDYSVKNMFNNYWNVFGLHGIIWEWVYDFNSVIIIGTDSEGSDSEQLLFCGAASENSINPIDYVGFMRFSFRNSLDSVFSLSSLGFRCVKSLYLT